MERTLEAESLSIEPTIIELGETLPATLKVKFPSMARCGDCGFRRQYHEPANQLLSEVVDPFVLTLKLFVEQVAQRLDGQE
jgi:hypothetical protein